MNDEITPQAESCETEAPVPAGTVPPSAPAQGEASQLSGGSPAAALPEAAPADAALQQDGECDIPAAAPQADPAFPGSGAQQSPEAAVPSVPPLNEMVEELLLRSHFSRLQEQAEAMKTAYPDFSLSRELENPSFLRMTSPEIGIPVEDAYFALHRKELQAKAGEAIAREAERKVTAAVQAGLRRPAENGGTSAGTVPRLDYASMTARQKQEFLDYARRASARGEKVYL